MGPTAGTISRRNRRVDIPKPDGKGMRQLGIPTVIDRLIQQALHQVMQPVFDCDFSQSSYGFRPGRSAHQAALSARAPRWNSGASHMNACYRKSYLINLVSCHCKINYSVYKVLHGTEPYARWCGRTAGAIPPPTRLYFRFSLPLCATIW
jgi:hypothetical protein